MKNSFAHASTALALAIAAAFPAHAALERVGPINFSPSVGGFPAWFQDKTGLALEFCDIKNPSELDGGWCLLLPGDVTFPESFPGNFFDEHFYWAAGATLNNGTVKAGLTLALESAFANGAAQPGDQMVFGRVRVSLSPAPAAGTYTVYHPYGRWVIPNVVAGERIFVTEDIGTACVNTFACAIDSSIGPFLTPSPTPGGAEVPPIPDLAAGQDPFHDALGTGVTPYPGSGKKYIADPARLGPVTGSRLAPFVGSDGVTYDHNTFRIEGPNGFVMQTNHFSVIGRVMTGALPGKVAAKRANYAQPAATPTGKKLDVFAEASPTTVGRVPGQPTPQVITPVLTFFDVPCGGTVDPATGEVQPPFLHPTGGNEIQMVSAGTKYWGQSHPAAVPTHVCLEDSTARDAAGQVVPVFYNVKVTDQVGVTSATYDAANGGTLTVRATSSDAMPPGPVLSVAGYGEMTGGALTVAPLGAPPDKVTVVSSEGGTADLAVSTAVGIPSGGAYPYATNDEVSMNEDCSASASTSCGTASLTITPLANDTYQNAPIGAGATLAIVVGARMGTLVVNADNTLTYTPNSNINGVDGIGYTVTVDGKTSNTAYISIHINAVNDVPVAVPESMDAVLGFTNTVNLLANDTDPDGAADLANVQIATWPAELGAQPVPANGRVAFTPVAAGPFSFTYNTVDAAGAVSASPATTTVNVQASENIAFVTAPTYRRDQSRWQVSGTSSVKASQTITLAYGNGTLTAAEGGATCDGTASVPQCVVATATVDNLGNWSIDLRGVSGAANPTGSSWATRPTEVRGYSSSPVLGGSRTASIVIR